MKDGAAVVFSLNDGCDFGQNFQLQYCPLRLLPAIDSCPRRFFRQLTEAFLRLPRISKIQKSPTGLSGPHLPPRRSGYRDRYLLTDLQVKSVGWF